MFGPVITVFARHSASCKHKGDELYKRCNCPKHLRWTAAGKQHRKATNARTWQEAEAVKRALEDQLAGRSTAHRTGPKSLGDSIDLFIKNKTVEGISAGVIGKYTRELARLQNYCERHGVFTAEAVTRELLTGYCVTWESLYASTQTRAMVRARCRSFLRFCYESQWIERIPQLPKIQVDVMPTMPLTAEEYERLINAALTLPKGQTVRALLQLMRWSGLAIRDALTLERAELRHDEARGIYRVTTARQKTGTHVSVPLPPVVAEELLALPNADPRYFFWDGESDIVKSWTKYQIPPAFKAAQLDRGGNMVSHRLRDTFAVDLLEKGVPLEEVSKLLGHESIKTTERHYAKWVQGRQDRLDKLVRETWD